MRQFHNQPAGSPLDRWLTELWAAVRPATGGRLDVRVCPQNDGVAGGDPEALRMLLAAIDGPLGAHVRAALGERGVHAIPRACFENGFRHISTSTRPIRAADDLVGLRIRTPAGRLFVDFFESLGARPTPRSTGCTRCRAG
jgi:TRAP-type C4-dicarboxylate transport system substrate-binding protein